MVSPKTTRHFERFLFITSLDSRPTHCRKSVALYRHAPVLHEVAVVVGAATFAIGKTLQVIGDIGGALTRAIIGNPNVAMT